MNRLKILLGATVFVSLVAASCRPDDIAKKELELRERDLALREKEFALRESAATQLPSVSPAPAPVGAAAPEISRDPLVVNPQRAIGPLGKAVFSKNDEALFYFERKPQKGRIVVNNVAYVLSTLSQDGCSYRISGDEVNVKALNCEYDETAGGDCAYGTFSKVTIVLRGVETSIRNVKLQDCPDLAF